MSRTAGYSHGHNERQRRQADGRAGAVVVVAGAAIVVVVAAAAVVVIASTIVKSVCFVGAGFVGGPTAALVAYHNPDIIVNVVDLNADRVAAWNSPHLPIHEAGLPKIDAWNRPTDR
ncbi:hypothetical protein BN1723_006693 [Verticillium longisporum]|uniref:UDP-glucose/GDP-mannose dehydrogenase N-terminal domain-containing protein n=1 Tax=Verticillium longisporum TaxID=100787 RepID=A0A0G4NG68_VERLO|nr:hypothetical protein BN1723_006693 [Verticillium longisporum]